jgi:GT2 family glycosyltransferase
MSNAEASCIALITVLFNCEKYLPLFFQCMGRQTDQNFKIIIIDNASHDASLSLAHALAQKHAVPCDFIANDKNLGISTGNNQGVDRARELGIKQVVLINNDISCEDNLIDNIRKRAVDSKLPAWTCLSYRGDSQERWFGGGYLSWWLARGIHFDKVTSERITEPKAITYAPTCLMYLKMDVFDRIGLMDARYFVYYDDTDFCKRMLDHGIELTYDPTVSFRHYVGGSSGGEFSPFFLRINTRNKFLFINKHYRASTRWLIKGIAIVSKLVQMIDKRRRKPTWEGMCEAFSDGQQSSHLGHTL